MRTERIEKSMSANSKVQISNLRSTLLCALCGRSVSSVLKAAIRRQTTRVIICLLVITNLLLFNVNAQTPVASPTSTPQAATGDPLTRTMNAVCTEREQDPQGSAAIDEMQARPSLPLLHADVLAGAKRAERLLPLAKTLAAAALRGLARAHRVSQETLQTALARLAEVRHVKPDVELRDNASVYYQDPHTIRFGTLFLAGLRSDESMVSVLAHELTHVADGPDSMLSVLFRRVARQAWRATQTRITGHRAEELTCDLVGALAARAYIARTESVEPLARRAARAVEHNCVTRDVTDTAHLSPRRTLLALLALDPVLAREITGEQQATLPPPRRVRGRRAAAHATPR